MGKTRIRQGDIVFGCFHELVNQGEAFEEVYCVAKVVYIFQKYTKNGIKPCYELSSSRSFCNFDNYSDEIITLKYALNRWPHNILHKIVKDKSPI